MLVPSVGKYRHLLDAQTTHTKLNVTFSVILYSSTVSVALLAMVIKTRTMKETVIMPTAPPLNTEQQNQWLLITQYNALKLNRSCLFQQNKTL